MSQCKNLHYLQYTSLGTDEINEYSDRDFIEASEKGLIGSLMGEDNIIVNDDGYV